MELFKKNRLLQAMMMAAMATGLAACGADGDDGKDGANGTTSLTSTTVVAVGSAECANGGTVVSTGMDDNANGVLDSAEIDSSVNVCNGSDGTDGVDGTDGTDGVNGSAVSIKFVGVDAPSTDAEKREIMVSQAVVKGEIYGGVYNTLARSGDVIDGIPFGLIVDDQGNAVLEEDNSERITDANEHTSLLPINGRLFSVSQMETRPGAMFLFELNQNSTTGALTVKSMSQIDQKGVDGGWVHCAASVTPWTTHLASEEYEPDAKKLPTATEVAADSYSSTQLDYFKSGDLNWNPYYYGWNIEVEVATDSADAASAATTELTKHYSMGRLAFELAYVMPDSKTVYMTDDGTNVGFYMFIADTAGDLSAGTLYAAKWNQTSADGVGAANLTWVSLGHTTDSAISDYVHGTNGKTAATFTDIFTAVDPVGGVCADGYTSINANGVGQECLKINTGMELVASRLETRRYAAMMGATTELRKEEGITYDSKRHKIYLAMSEVAKGMLDGDSTLDVGGPNDMKLAAKNSCGAVYQLELGSDSTIGSDYVAKNMSGLVAGRPVSASDPQVAGFEDNNSCHINGIANPDNLTYMSGYDQLIIGEDTDKHQNDVIWAYDLAAGELTRIQTTPYGSETTSPYWYPNINGFAYLMSVVQHPYGESDMDQDTTGTEHRAYTGYIGPFPAIQ